MLEDNQPIHGRGVSGNPTNRFDRLAYEPDPDAEPDEIPIPRTQFYRDQTKTIIATNDSPDVGFTASINPYRGCEHGCSYCYARPYHEYLGLSAGLDFETKIFVKEQAADLLREELKSPRWQPQVLGLSGVTDAYQPIERHLQITRKCLQVLVEFRNPVVIVTKNRLVCRDIDFLAELAHHHAVAVFLSLTTLDSDLQQKLEPRASHPQARLTAIRQLKEAGIPVGSLIAPIIPGLTDHEIPALLEAVAKAGASFAGYTTLRLPHAVAHLFSRWLDHHFPQSREKVLSRIRDMHGGQLNDSRFGIRMHGEGILADMIQQLFRKTSDRLGLGRRPRELSCSAFRNPVHLRQPTLFDDLEG